MILQVWSGLCGGKFYIRFEQGFLCSICWSGHVLTIPKTYWRTTLNNVLDSTKSNCVQQSKVESFIVSCEYIHPPICIQCKRDSGESRTKGTDWEEGKQETLTCFSPSILLSACWTPSRYLKCNSISRSTWSENNREWEMQYTTKQPEKSMRKMSRKEETAKKHNKMRLENMEKLQKSLFSSHLSFTDSFLFVANHFIIMGRFLKRKTKKNNILLRFKFFVITYSPRH